MMWHCICSLEVAARAYLLCTLSQMVPYKIVKGDNGDAWVEASAVAEPLTCSAVHAEKPL